MLECMTRRGVFKIAAAGAALSAKGADERMNRIDVLIQEQRHLLASQIQISHDATARHDAAMAQHDAAMAKINATLEVNTIR